MRLWGINYFKNNSYTCHNVVHHATMCETKRKWSSRCRVFSRLGGVRRRYLPAAPSWPAQMSRRSQRQLDNQQEQFSLYKCVSLFLCQHRARCNCVTFGDKQDVFASHHGAELVQTETAPIADTGRLCGFYVTVLSSDAISWDQIHKSAFTKITMLKLDGHGQKLLLYYSTFIIAVVVCIEWEEGST